MDTVPLSIQVLEGRPLLVITPYRNSPIEIINIISESLIRSQMFRIDNDNLLLDSFVLLNSPMVYTDRQYSDIDIPVYHNQKIQQKTVIIMTTVMDHIPYDPNIIPIYVIEWGIRNNSLQRYLQWLGTEPTILYPTFVNIVPEPSSPEIIEHPTDNKITTVLQVIRSMDRTHAIVCSSDQLELLRTSLKDLYVPLYDANQQSIRIINRYQHGIIIATNLGELSNLDSKIPLHILNFDSDNGMEILISAKHESIHMYITPDGFDMDQWQLFLSGIQDCNQVYTHLVHISYELISDTYNNLFVIH